MRILTVMASEKSVAMERKKRMLKLEGVVVDISDVAVPLSNRAMDNKLWWVVLHSERGLRSSTSFVDEISNLDAAQLAFLYMQKYKSTLPRTEKYPMISTDRQHFQIVHVSPNDCIIIAPREVGERFNNVYELYRARERKLVPLNSNETPQHRRKLETTFASIDISHIAVNRYGMESDANMYWAILVIDRTAAKFVKLLSCLHIDAFAQLIGSECRLRLPEGDKERREIRVTVNYIYAVILSQYLRIYVSRRYPGEHYENSYSVFVEYYSKNSGQSIKDDSLREPIQV
jgi:hypothetical protein